MLGFESRQPWKTRRERGYYTTVDLKSRSDRRVARTPDGVSRVTIASSLVERPLYLVLGLEAGGPGTVLRLEQAERGSSYLLAHLVDRGKTRTMMVPSEMSDGEGVVVGREATPRLALPRDISREHLRFVASMHQLDIFDLNSTFGTVVHTPNNPFEHTSIGPLRATG